MKTRIDSIAWNNRSIAAFCCFFLWIFAFSLSHPGAFGSTTDDVRPTAAAAAAATEEQQLTTAANTSNWRSDWATANGRDVTDEDRRPSASFAPSLLTDDAVSREPDDSTREMHEHAGSTAGLSVDAPGTTRLSRDSHVTSDSVVYQSNAVDSEETTGLTTETTVSHRATKATDATADVAKETTSPDDNDGEATQSTTTASDYAIAKSITMSAHSGKTATIATTATTTQTGAISTLTPTASINTSSTAVRVPAEPAATTAATTDTTTATTTATTTVLSEADLVVSDSATTETTATEKQPFTETEQQNRATAVATAVLLPGDNETLSSIPRSQKTALFVVSGATETTPGLLRGSTDSTDNDDDDDDDDAEVSDSGSNRTSTTATTRRRVATKSAFSSSSQSSSTVAASTEASTAAVSGPVLTFSFSCLIFVLFMRTMS